MSSITLLLLLCLSVHACNARFLDKQGNFFNKGVNKAKLHKTQIGLQLGHSALLTHVQKEIGTNNERKMYVNEEESKAFMKEVAAASKSATSGDNYTVPSQNDFQLSVKTEVLQSSRARSLLVGDDTDEALDSQENDFVEDIAVMDYAQPHRKPPIHNERP